MIEPDDFAERLRNKEIAKRDQQDGAATQKVRQAETDAFLYANAKNEFKNLRAIAEGVIKGVNQSLEGPKYIVGDAAGGFYISLGRHSAGFGYSQVYQNAGEIFVTVLVQQQQSNFEMFGLPSTERHQPSRRYTFIPCGDAESQTIAWRSDGATYSSDELIKSFLDILMDRN